MKENNLQEPQAYAVQQGKLLNNKSTDKFSLKQHNEYDYEERKRMFKNFSELDQRKTREYLATFSSPKQCADFVAMHNRLLDKIDMLEYQLNEALDELKMHGV
jgi:hypothetical protein